MSLRVSRSSPTTLTRDEPNRWRGKMVTMPSVGSAQSCQSLRPTLTSVLTSLPGKSYMLIQRPGTKAQPPA